jgi:hypothetical protein
VNTGENILDIWTVDTKCQGKYESSILYALPIEITIWTKKPLGVPDMVKLFTKTEHMYSEFLIAKGSQARQYSFMTKLKTEFQFSKTWMSTTVTLDN